MKLRKNDLKVRKSFFAARWIFRNPSEGISDFLGGGGLASGCWLVTLVHLVPLVLLGS